MSANDIPEWAKDRALALAKADSIGGGFSSSDGHYYGDMKTAFARYIAAHEKAPVDPVEVEAEVILRNAGYRLLESAEHQLVRKALRRGIELAKAGEA